MRTLSGASASHFRRQHRAAHPPQNSEPPTNPTPTPNDPPPLTGPVMLAPVSQHCRTHDPACTATDPAFAPVSLAR